MAALSIAFEGPDNFVNRTPSQQRPIDLVLLATQTMGNKATELEVLQIFARQARGCLQVLGTHLEHGQIAAAASRLKNAANAVGAHRVAEAAEALETSGATPDSLATVASAVLEAEHFILKLAR